MLQGDLYDHESLVKAIKQVDVVISTVGQMQLADQVKIIAAIKEAGNVKVPMNSVFCFLNFNWLLKLNLTSFYDSNSVK